MIDNNIFNVLEEYGLTYYYNEFDNEIQLLYLPQDIRQEKLLEYTKKHKLDKILN